jgi:phage gp36-like protein
MTYCGTDDLLVGSIPIPDYLNPEKVVSDAADEIDTYIGFRYTTPVVLAETAENRPAILLLKRINSHLASGRLLMEAAASSENVELNAYAKRLVDEALAALIAIRDGEIILGDAPILPGTEASATGPMQYNKDSRSMVDAFYDDIVWAPIPTVPVQVWPI